MLMRAGDLQPGMAIVDQFDDHVVTLRPLMHFPEDGTPHAGMLWIPLEGGRGLIVHRDALVPVRAEVGQPRKSATQRWREDAAAIEAMLERMHGVTGS